MVREDAHILYGFATEEERRLFRNLLKVSGVGPKIALGVLSGMSVEGFTRCVLGEDVTTLTRIPGIGRKTAERLIIEMRDRVNTQPAVAGTRGRARGQRSAQRGLRCAGGPAVQAGRGDPLAQRHPRRYPFHRGTHPAGAAGRDP